MTVIHQTARGFVTDMGSSHDAKDEEGNVITHVHRYGAWTRYHNEWRVTFTTDDRQRACDYIGEK